MNQKNKHYWNLCTLTMIILSIITFSPLVIPAGKYTPTLFSLPRTLWAGMLVYILMVVITFIGTKVYPGNEKSKGENK